MLETSENISAVEQEARAKLRESYIKAVNALIGEPCSILTYEQSTLEATFSGWNPDGTEVLVTGLKTPANIKIPSALLRTPDIIAIQFKKSLPL